MGTGDVDRTGDVIGDAIADAVRRAVDEVGRAPLAEIGNGDERTDPPPVTSTVKPPRATSDDPYEVLGVGRSASWDDVVAAHRRLARAWHPDAPGGDEDLIRRLNAAFAELKVRRGR